jgi:peptidoglycan/LPS O-acetylase OafA/YrhL
MPPALPLRSRLEPWFRRAPVPALRDVVEKQPSAGRNLDALDGVRGLAVLIVVASHADGLYMKGHGAVGVWLFFVLSAFLLTLPYAADPARIARPTQLTRYSVRRLLRILPAYYFAIVVVALLGREDLGFVGQHLAFVRATGIFWTIPQEMLFYVLLPPLVALHRFVFRERFAATLLGLAALALAANLWLTPAVFALHGNDKLLPFHLGVFVTGMAFAYASRAPQLVRIVEIPAVNRALDALGLLILACLIFSAPAYLEKLKAILPALGTAELRVGLQYKGSIGVLCGALVYITLVCEGRLTHRILSSLLLRSLGVVSFSLYLFHVMVQNGIQRLWVDAAPGQLLFLANLAATFAVACCVYSLIERPCLRFARSWPAARKTDAA